MSILQDLRYLADAPLEKRGGIDERVVETAKQAAAVAMFEARRPKVTDQPPPAPNGSTPIWDLVIADMQARDRVGRERYGTPLQAGNGRDALQDAYEESLDKTVYLKQAIVERDELRDKIKAELIRVRLYVMRHGALVGECVAWSELKAMFNVGVRDQDDLVWLSQYEGRQKVGGA